MGTTHSAPTAAASSAAPAAPAPPRTQHDIRRIAVEARRDPRTVRAAYAGRAALMTTIDVTEAAVRLGYAAPPQRDDA